MSLCVKDLYPQSHVFQIGILLLAVLGLSTCTDKVTAPSDAPDPFSRFDVDGRAARLMLGPDSLAACDGTNSFCIIQDNSCVCSHESIGVNVQGGAGDPGVEHTEPPGWPSPDWLSWPIPPGQGGPPPPDPATACDPNAISSSCKWTAELSCPVDAVRGEVDGCTFFIEPASALDYISGWTFEGDNINISVSHSDASWSGTLVESGKVWVDYMANGREARIVSEIHVVPRSSGVWTQAHWESQMSFHPGQAYTGCTKGGQQRVELYNDSTRLGWTTSLSSAQAGGCDGQAIEPKQYPTIVEIPSGPQQGGWYVSDVPSYHFTSASQIHPGAGAGAAASTLVDSAQAALCRTNLGLPAGPVSINFWNFNNACEQVPGWSGFISAVWAHEQGHYDQAEAELKQPGNNIYIEMEAVVRGNQFDAMQRSTAVHDRIQSATENLVEPTGNWSTPFWIWAGSGMDWFINLTSFSF